MFYDYLVENYSKYFDKDVLEVGCGRTMRLSRMLKNHFNITAFSPDLKNSI